MFSIRLHESTAFATVTSLGATEHKISRPRKQSYQNAKIPFTKASACGNDFLIVEGTYAFGDLSALSHRLCDRHRGVGANGVEWLFPDAEADARLRLFNADGCGGGNFRQRHALCSGGNLFRERAKRKL